MAARAATVVSVEAPGGNFTIKFTDNGSVLSLGWHEVEPMAPGGVSPYNPADTRWGGGNPGYLLKVGDAVTYDTSRSVNRPVRLV